MNYDLLTKLLDRQTFRIRSTIAFYGILMLAGDAWVMNHDIVAAALTIFVIINVLYRAKQELKEDQETVDF